MAYAHMHVPCKPVSGQCGSACVERGTNVRTGRVRAGSARGGGEVCVLCEDWLPGGAEAARWGPLRISCVKHLCVRLGWEGCGGVYSLVMVVWGKDAMDGTLSPGKGEGEVEYGFGRIR